MVRQAPENFLQSPEQWSKWHSMVIDRASALGIPEYINVESRTPDLVVDLQKPAEPSDDVTSAVDWQKYQVKFEVHRRNVQDIGVLIDFMKHTLSKEFEDTYVRLTPTQLYHQAKRYYAPSMEYLDHQLHTQYEEHKSNYQAEDTSALDAWLNKWRYFQDRGSESNVSWTSKFGIDFIELVKKDFQQFYDRRNAQVRTGDLPLLALLEIFRMELFRPQSQRVDEVQELRDARTEAWSTSNTTLTEPEPPSQKTPVAVSKEKEKDRKKLSECICGLVHRYSDCYHLNSEKRPIGYPRSKREAETQSWVVGKLRRNEELKRKVEKSIGHPIMLSKLSKNSFNKSRDVKAPSDLIDLWSTPN